MQRLSWAATIALGGTLAAVVGNSAVASGATITSNDGTVTFDGAPSGGETASSSYDGSHGPANLFDATALNPNDIGTTNDNLGTNQYASSGGTGGLFPATNADVNPVVSLDFGTNLVTANSIVYSQRSGAQATTDKVSELKIWFTNSAFTPSRGSGNPALDPTPSGSPTEDLTGLLTTTQNLTEYTFANGSHTSRYVVIQFVGASQTTNADNNPGGSELRLANDSLVPEPASCAILALGAAGLLARRRRA